MTMKVEAFEIKMRWNRSLYDLLLQKYISLNLSLSIILLGGFSEWIRWQFLEYLCEEYCDWKFWRFYLTVGLLAKRILEYLDTLCSLNDWPLLCLVSEKLEYFWHDIEKIRNKKFIRRKFVNI